MCSTVEELAAAVQRYPVLYDKADADFHRKELKINAWNTISDELHFKNGDHAEKAFLKLRDRYARTRKAMRKRQDGSSDKMKKKASEKLNRLQFLQWLDEHIKPRKSRTNEELFLSPGCENDIEVNEAGEKKETIEKKEHKENDIENEIKYVQETQRDRKTEVVSNMQDSTEFVKEKANIVCSSTTHEPDEYDLFGQYVARKMRKLKQILQEDAMDAIEYDITIILLEARSNSNKVLSNIS